jgi:putative ABC transport system permease protein
MEGHDVDMRAMINSQDLHAIKGDSAFIHYRYLVTGDAKQTQKLIKWQQQDLPAAKNLPQTRQSPAGLLIDFAYGKHS